MQTIWGKESTVGSDFGIHKHTGLRSVPYVFITANVWRKDREYVWPLFVFYWCSRGWNCYEISNIYFLLSVRVFWWQLHKVKKLWKERSFVDYRVLVQWHVSNPSKYPASVNHPWNASLHLRFLCKSTSNWGMICSCTLHFHTDTASHVGQYVYTHTKNMLKSRSRKVYKSLQNQCWTTPFTFVTDVYGCMCFLGMVFTTLWGKKYDGNWPQSTPWNR